MLSPDFSMYLEMTPVMPFYNVFCNRWCGTYWVSNGVRAISTANYGGESTFDLHFAGIERWSIVAAFSYMVSDHDSRCDQKEWLIADYQENAATHWARKNYLLQYTVSRKCKEISFMWIMSAVPGDIWTMNEVSDEKIWTSLKLAAHRAVTMM